MPETVDNSDESGIIHLEDIQIYRSLGAMARNFDVIDLETGEMFHFAEGTRIQNITVFAGKGTKVEYRIAEQFAKRYGGNAEDWQHVKGDGLLRTPDGDRRAEVHWSRCSGIGNFEFFIKKWLE